MFGILIVWLASSGAEGPRPRECLHGRDPKHCASGRPAKFPVGNTSREGCRPSLGSSTVLIQIKSVLARHYPGHAEAAEQPVAHPSGQVKDSPCGRFARRRIRPDFSIPARTRSIPSPRIGFPHQGEPWTAHSCSYSLYCSCSVAADTGGHGGVARQFPGALVKLRDGGTCLGQLQAARASFRRATDFSMPSSGGPGTP
jgi:hypothetical protein